MPPAKRKTPANAVKAENLADLDLGDNSRIIEFDVESPVLCRALMTAGYKNYLGLARDEAILDAVREEAPEFAASFYLMDPEDRNCSRNNAEVVILKPRTVRGLRSGIKNARLKEIWWTERSLRQRLSGRLLLWWHRHVRKRIGKESALEVILEHGEKVILRRVKKCDVRTKLRARRYISPKMGIMGFLKELNREGIRYVVLRWFEDLPRPPPGEDIDFLVHDDDLEKMTDVLNNASGTLPCDLYSVSGLPGSSYLGMAYFPPFIAEDILRDRMLYEDYAYVPCPEHHFLSMAYHAAYHKAERSGLPERAGMGSEEAPGEHPYSEILRDLAGAIGKKIEPALTDLHNALSEEGWNPPGDVLRKLGRRSPWVAGLLPRRENRSEKGELMAFVVREWAAERNMIDEIVSWLEKHGLEILKVKRFDEKQQRKVSRLLRGGNWHAGPWPVGGGRAWTCA